MQNKVKFILRLAVFVICAGVAVGCFLPDGARPYALGLPRVSPILSFLGALAARRVAGWLCLAGVPLLVLAVFKSRWFCWHLCPMGFAAEMAGRLHPGPSKLLARIPNLNKILFLLLAVSAAVGYPIFVWLDPLCIFNGFFTAWREPFAWTSALTGAGFVLILLASLVVPNIWCHRLCPLGGLQELLGKPFQNLKRKVAAVSSKAPAKAAGVDRRTFVGLAAGGLAAAAGRAVTGREKPDAIRPPSAVRVDFNAVCARCGNCMRACPKALIQPDVGLTGLDGLLTPVVRYRHLAPDQEEYCFQDCTACTQVCPTGALRPITVEQKHALPMGLAVVDKAKCIAWADKQYCVVCQEYCPYQAVIEVERNGVMCPEIDSKKCRGCGACESACPADPIAIIVKNQRSAQ